MNIQFTPQQLQALDAGQEPAPRMIDPYETVREVLEDERRQRAIRVVARRNAIGRMNETP